MTSMSCSSPPTAPRPCSCRTSAPAPGRGHRPDVQRRSRRRPRPGWISGGTFKPSRVLDDGIADPFPAPAPAGPWGAALSGLDGTSPNGTWSLYVVDDADGGVGSLSGGWSLCLTATASAGGPYSTGGFGRNLIGVHLTGPARCHL